MKRRPNGFTLIELLTTLLILSLLALMSYRGLNAVLDGRAQARQETEKWRRIESFFARFERDVLLASPRAVRSESGSAPSWRAQSAAPLEPRLEFSRFASADGVDTARRIAYGLNEKREIELWVWPGLDTAPTAMPARYPVLAGVTALELHYLSPELIWVDVWPVGGANLALPRAVRLRVVLASGEEFERLFALI
ncbi:MAG: type II secretion system protein GspJ [Betaproteobacteria bacterium]|nr:type II secretion system protein GspJ [Betaproteobacteria bacterium]MBI2960094.1 type II secretion system protein GspJ [Betaproteobacteria bacterium]